MLSVQEKEPKREREQALIEMAEGDAVVREPSNWLVLMTREMPYPRSEMKLKAKADDAHPRSPQSTQ